MTSNAIIQGTFADLKTVKTRSVVQMIVEVPIEQASSVVDMFGFPQPGAEVSVAVARLVEQQKPEKPRQRFEDMSRAQQAGILCGEDHFRQFIRVETADDAKRWVYEHCGVTSRSEIDAKAPQMWDQLVGNYRLWERYGDMRP